MQREHFIVSLSLKETLNTQQLEELATRLEFAIKVAVLSVKSEHAMIAQIEASSIETTHYLKKEQE